VTALSNPFARPLHQLAVELAFAICFALITVHALGSHRRGERHHLIQWAIAVCYGVTMELVAYHFVKNFQHAQFTVQLCGGQMPLYVVFVYPVFHYTGLELAQRYRLSWIAEALLAGFVICLLDVPFDIAGIAAGWWRWSAADPKLAVRWLDVPVVDLYWYCIFGACYASLCRLARVRLAKRPLALQLALAPLLGLLVIVLGTIAFLPYHGLHALGLHEDWIVAAHLAGCGALAAWAATRIDPTPAPRALIAVPVVLELSQLATLIALGARGQLGRAPIQITTAIAATVALSALTWPIVRRARALATT
jgi:hypothetical protein